MRCLWPTLALVLLACGSSHGPGGPEADAGPTPDATFRPDAISLPDAPWGPHDAWGPDAGPWSPCAPDQAEARICPELVCDGLPSWHWNGDSCFPIECGACDGPDCARGASSREECEGAHATCESFLCRATGGTWMWWMRECGHFFCGRSGPGDCDPGWPVCNCGPNSRFAEGEGCVPTDCPILEPPPTRQQLCEFTGGTWDNYCCDSVCGMPCEAACAALACDCGPGREFLESGCVGTARCHERGAGETCDDTTRCAPGMICCMHCGGVGCFGQTCEYPVCDDDDCTDLCGNRCDVP